MTQGRMTLRVVFASLGILCGSMPARAQEAKKAAAVFAVLYYRGPTWLEGKSPFEQPNIREHIRHHENLGERLIAAAPFAAAATDPAVGMVLLFADNEEAAHAWAKADPAVSARVMDVKVYPWRISTLRGCFERQR